MNKTELVVKYDGPVYFFVLGIRNMFLK